MTRQESSLEVGAHSQTQIHCTHLDGYQHLVAVWAEVGTLGQVHLAKRSLAQLPLQHDVLPLDVLDTFPTKTKVSTYYHR